jgi:endonuclease YncB( thermonuclease family)
MSRRPKPWSARRRRKRLKVGFPVIVAGVAALAFVATWKWPSNGVSLREAPPVAASALLAPEPARMTCRVASVTDGDTLRCQDGVRVRLHAVAARERDGSCSAGHPCPAASAEAATQELRRLAAGRTLSCSPTGHSYNRITAICWTPSGEEVNCAMVRSGTALLWARFDREQPLCR